MLLLEVEDIVDTQKYFLICCAGPCDLKEMDFLEQLVWELKLHIINGTHRERNLSSCSFHCKEVVGLCV